VIKKPVEKRTLHLKGLGKNLELGKVATIKFGQSKKEFIYLEKMDDGEWRLVYTESTIPDIQKLEALEIIRNNGNVSNTDTD